MFTIIMNNPLFWAMFLIWLVTIALFFQLQGAAKREEKRKKRNDPDWREFRVIEKVGKDVHIVLRTMDMEPLYVSVNAADVLGLSLDELYDDWEVLFDLMEPADIRNLKSDLSAWNEGDTDSLVREVELTNAKTGEKFWTEFTFSKTAKNNKTVIRIADVTTAHNTIEEMQADLEEQQEENRSRIAFLNSMSHEIRTPMNGVLGMLSLARINLENKEAVGEYLDKAESLSQYLLSLINDILDVSRIESGKIILAKEPFSIYSMADNLSNMFRQNIEEKGITFEINTDDVSYPYLIGDEMRLNQVIINFISNSMKFTESGGLISITFRQMQVIDRNVHLMIRVRDTGKGIDPEFLSRIFKPFEQESTKVTKRYGGSGLGMNIADNLVRLMGGQIVIDSELGKGSDFTVYITLPICDTFQEKTTDQTHEDFHFEGKKVLLAEDNDINAEIAMEMLEIMGAEVVRAVDGAKAVEAFAESEAEEYDLILMDIQMPEMNGYDATAAIRKMSREDAKTILIIAMSADAFVEDKRHAISMGMNGHIAKPVDFGNLEEHISQILA